VRAFNNNIRKVVDNHQKTTTYMEEEDLPPIELLI
jgi:hypothetical protein